MDFIATLTILTNQARAKPLLQSAPLDKAAQVRADQTCIDFSHAKFHDVVPMINASYIGENLAKDFSTPQAIQTAFMASPKHKENITNPIFKFIGIAEAKLCNNYAFIFSN
jgi:uncharacterized protein YkwD